MSSDGRTAHPAERCGASRPAWACLRVCMCVCVCLSEGANWCSRRMSSGACLPSFVCKVRGVVQTVGPNPVDPALS